jgi:acetyl esterase/lipase
MTRSLRRVASAGLALFLAGSSFAFAADPAPSAPKATPTPNFVGALTQKLQPSRTLVYKQVDGRELHLDIFEPKGLKPGDKRACFVGIHGGGWTGGNTRVMYTYTNWAAERGMVGVSGQYRLLDKKTPNVTVVECVKDGRSMIRYLKEHATELGIDPKKIIVSGASAGGHVAIETAMADGMDEASDNLKISSTPAATILFTPVIDTSEEGYGHAKAGPRWKELSPAHNVRAGLPPTLLFHGTADTTCPFKGAQIFHDEMIKTGNRCDFIVEPGGQHTFMFKDKTLYERSLQQIDAFLTSLKL